MVSAEPLLHWWLAILIDAL